MRDKDSRTSDRSVPLDYFMFSCLEFERLYKSSLGKVEKIKGHPDLAGFSIARNLDKDLNKNTDQTPADEQPSVDTAAPAIHASDEHEDAGEINGNLKEPEKPLPKSDLDLCLEDLICWYQVTFPSLCAYNALSRDILAEVVGPTVLLSFDLIRFSVAKSEPIPTFNEKIAETSSFWLELNQLIEKRFPVYAPFITSYLHWTFGEEKVESIEPGSRPPVGRFSPRFGRGSGSHDGPRDHDGPRRPRGPRTRGPENSQGFQNDRPYRGDRGRDRGDDRRPPRDRYRDNHGNGHGDRGDFRAENARRAEEKALKDVARALRELKADSALEEVLLLPTNSFLRRLQHRHINQAGFYSGSIGEGQNRAIKVTRVPGPNSKQIDERPPQDQQDQHDSQQEPQEDPSSQNNE